MCVTYHPYNCDTRKLLKILLIQSNAEMSDFKKRGS